MKLRISIAFAVVSLFSCERNENTTRWKGVTYEIFVRSFADGNGDSIGDFKGITSKLDYLKELGIEGIWLMPMMKSPSYHKYDVVDYKSVDPEYGTIEDFKQFLSAAHQRHIKVVIDLVMNHSSDRHPWFQEAIKGKDNPYHNYYVWARKDSIRRQIDSKEVILDSDNLRQWHAVKGDTLADQYYGFFSGRMPDLNFDNPEVKKEFIEIGKYWLQEVGVDGFRLDAARYIFPREREADNHEFWVWFRTEMEKFKPNVYLVGEVWTSPEEAAPYLKGLHSVFNFGLSGAITEVVKFRKDRTGSPIGVHFLEDYQRTQAAYRKESTSYLDATFLSNHDQNRIASEFDDNLMKARAAAGILLTLPGTPYIYYGEELGMKGKKPDEHIREPFLWSNDQSDSLRTRWIAPVYSTDASVPPQATQNADSSSLYRFYKKMIHYRNSSGPLTHGSIDDAVLGVPDVIAFRRTWENQTVLVVHNISPVSSSIKLDSQNVFSAIDFTSAGNASVANGILTLPGYSMAILK